MIGWVAQLAASGPVIPNFGKGSTCIVQNHQFCASWFFDNFGSRFEPRLIEHLELTGIAVGIGAAIAFTAAIIAHKNAWFETPFSLLSAFLYTIPRLAFFELMVPITGINRLSAEIALVSYTLLILFRNTLAGLRGVPAAVVEAASAVGLTPRQTPVSRRAPAGPAGHHGRAADCHRDDDQPHHRGRLHRRRRAGPAHLRRDPDRVQDRVRRRRSAGDRAGHRRRRGAGDLQRLVTPWSRRRLQDA